MKKEKVLDLIENGENFKLYYLHYPNTRINSTYIAFSKGTIILFGDLTPTDYGTVSTIGYDEKWFSGDLGIDYLCEKFLRKGWHKEIAIEYFEDEVNWAYLFGEYGVDKQTKVIVEDIIRELDDGEMDQTRLYDRLNDEGIEVHDGLPGWGYDPMEAKILFGIHKDFKELIKKENKI